MFKKNQKSLTILYVSANPDEKQIIRGDIEYMAIKNTIEKSPYSKYIHLEPAFALDRYKFKESISKYKPQILHFAGHGEKEKGVLFQDDKYQKFLDLKSETIDTLNDFKDTIQMIFFNVCESKEIAKNTSNFIDQVIGTRTKIEDNLAIEFSKVFYKNLFQNISLEESFNIAIDHYSIKYSQNKQDYLFFSSQDPKKINLEILMGEKFWNLYKKEFDPLIQPIVEWAIILLLNMKSEEKKKFITIFNSFLNNSLKIPDIIKEFEKNLNKSENWEISELVFRIWNNIEEHINFKSIEFEQILSKLLKALKIIKKNYSDNPELFSLEIFGFINSYKSNEEKQSKLLVIKEIPNYQELKIQLNLLIKNIKKTLMHIRVKNEADIEKYPDDILLKYCKQQLDLTDLASKYDYRFDKTLFVEDTELISMFEEFAENMEDKNNRQRIFILLGHMGLGKTWNACYLSFKYIEKKIPTFYFHLGGNYQSRFDILLGGFEKSKIKKICMRKTQNRNILIVFDGFDELYEDERNEFIKNLYNLVKENSEYLMVFLTSRLVDWVNTEELSKRSYYRDYIFQNEQFNYFEDLNIRTGASFILSDIVDDERLSKFIDKYGMKLDQIKDDMVKKLLRKPFILNLISRTDKNLIKIEFNSKNDDWFQIFAGHRYNDTILRRMGISDEVEDIFQELVSEIADPYTPIPEYELKTFIEGNRKNWDVIHSSGIIRRKRINLQYQYYFKEEYQGFIERYIVELEDRFQDIRICKADAKCLHELKQISRIKLNNISDYESERRTQGFVINKDGKITEFYLNDLSLTYIPPSIYKLIGLKKLNLLRNQINKISDDIKRLRNLEELNLAQNLLITLPPDLSKLPSLKMLNLEYNQLQSFKSWWNDFKTLKIVNISHNRYKSGELNGENSIDYVENNLEYLDNNIKYYDSKEIEPLKLKDAIVLDYLNSIRRKLSNQNVGFTIITDQNRIKQISLIKFPKLKPLFWTLEELEILELKDNSVPFMKNNMIKELRFIDQHREQKGNLEIEESISFLKNLEKISILGFQDINLPISLKTCQNLKIFKLFSKNYRKFPEIVLELKNLYFHLFHSSLDDSTFKQITSSFNEIDYYSLIRHSTGLNLPDIHLKPHISKFILVHVNNLPSTIIIKGKLKQLIIIQKSPFPTGFIKNLKFKEYLKHGCFFFNSQNQKFPSITNDFKDLCQLRIDNSGLGEIPNWALDSHNIKKLLITSFDLPPLETFFNEENKGLFEIRTSPYCNLLNDTKLSDSITHLRIDIQQLSSLPKFITSLKNTKQLLITSINFEDLTSQFGSEENKNRIEIKTDNQFNLTETLGKLENSTHLQIHHLCINKYPEELNSLINLRFIKIIKGNLRSIPHFLETLSKIKQIHINASEKHLFRSDFWSNEQPGRFEIQVPQDDFILQYLKNISHLRISYHNRIKLKEVKNDNEKDALNFDNLSNLHIEFIDGIPAYIREMKNLKILELNVNNLRQIPDWLSQFDKIRKLIITTRSIDFSENFWMNNSSSCFKIRVANNCIFPSFIKELQNLTHLWIEIPGLQKIPEEIIKTFFNKNKVKLYTNTEIEEDLDTYIELNDPKYFVLKIHPDCNNTELFNGN